MIRKTLSHTKQATFSLYVPSPVPEDHGMPRPNGTAFFISGDGYILTARHVVDGHEMNKSWLMQAGSESGMVQYLTIEREWPEFDLALLKADFANNANKAWLAERDRFPYIEIDVDLQEDGSPVYAFGYPLPLMAPVQKTGPLTYGHSGIGPRTTSAIISSSLEHTSMIITPNDPKVYVLDKALNYGNSGGPIVASETGRAFAVCTRFQPVKVKQPDETFVQVPSLYGIVSSIANIADDLREILAK